MRQITEWFENLPFALQLLWALPVLDGLMWGTYRIARGRIFAGLFWVVFGGVLLWPIDLLSLVIFGRVRALI